MTAYTRRDLTIVPMGDNDMVVACDTCGAVGLKSGDILKLPPHYVGKFTARVALTEVICAGAMPTVVVNGVACEMHPTGTDIILGIQEELANAGLSNVIITGSTEENFATGMTALAVTVIGTAAKGSLKFDKAAEDDKFVLLGRPKVGAEVDLACKGFYAALQEILTIQDVREVVPAGSKGIAYEVEMLAALNNTTYTLYDTDIDYKKSAGPATCLVILCSKMAAEQMRNMFPSAICIGEVTPPK